MSLTGAAHWTQLFLKSDGTPYSGVLVYHYEPSTTTDRTVYTDETAATADVQPSVGDDAGRVSFYGKGMYRLLVISSVADGSLTLYDFDPVKLDDRPSGLRSELQATSYPAANAANRGLMFFKVSAGGDVTEVGVNLDASGFSALQFQGTALTTTQQMSKGADLASATALTLGSDGNTFDVTGVTTITSISSKTAGTWMVLQFDGILTLTYNATSLILPGNEDIVTAAGDVSIWQSEGSGNWRCVSYVRRDGGNLFETKGDTLASATVAATAGSVATGQFYDISGTTAITAFGTLPAGRVRLIRFTGALVLTHNGTSLILPSAENITTANGDTAAFISLGSGNWLCLWYQQTARHIAANIELGTEQASTSGTSIDFTGIPSGTRRITIQLEGVSTNGTTDLIVQLGDAGGMETSGYVAGTFHSSAATHVTFTAGFGVFTSMAAAGLLYGTITLTLKDAANFTWMSASQAMRSDTAVHTVGSGAKSLSAELTQVRITAANGTDAFDAGSINIQYER